jgi:hypothetical protein
MATQTEPNLRLVNVSHDLLDESDKNAQSTVKDARDSEGTAESSARANVEGAIAGEIRNDWNLDGAPTATLLGVPGFSATTTPRATPTQVDAQKLFVSPETVIAIEKAKARITEPTVKVDLGVSPPVVSIESPTEGAPFHQHHDTVMMEPLRPITNIEAKRIQRIADRNRTNLTGRPELRDVHTNMRIGIKAKTKDGLPVIVERPSVEAPAAPQKWQQYEDLGLAPKPITKKLQKMVVSTYRLLGFSILTIIVAVLLGYIGTSVFYYLNKSWVTPVALSANDEKVVGLQSQLASQQNERAKLVSELEQSERAIIAEQTFQAQFAKAIKMDLEGRKAALDRVQALAMTAASTRNEIRTTNGNYSASTVGKMEKEYQAGLIDRDSMMAGKFQLAQISSANLSLAERQAEFDQRAAELAAQTKSLDAILADKTATSALSYEVLKIARDYETSKLALARETSNRERLKASIARQDTIINGVTSSAYMKAIADGATVALVPYKNLDNVSAGTPLYACKLNMFWCRQVGKVLEVLPGEVQVKEPNRDSMVRGRMIEMQMTEKGAEQEEVLFAGRKPLGL